MNFAESPVLYIIDYYQQKIDPIDLECEKAILSSKDDKEKSDLNVIRLDLINRLQNARKVVMDRYYLLESKFNQDMSQTMIEEIKDEIFMDQYCVVLDVYKKMRSFDFKFGLLIFSQYEDTLLKTLKYFSFNNSLSES